MSDLIQYRNDMQLPCKDCGKRYPGCRDHCQDPALLEGLRMREMAKADRKKRRDTEATDRCGRARRARVAACQKKRR